MGLDLEYIKGQTPIEEEEKEYLKIKKYQPELNLMNSNRRILKRL